GVAGQLVAQLVAHLAGEFVERHHARPIAMDTVQLTARHVLVLTRAAADLGDQQVPLDHRRAADSEEVLHHTELSRGVYLPNGLAVRDPHAMQHPFRAKGVYAIAIDHRRATRAVVVAVHVLIVGRIFELPQRLAGLALLARKPRLISEARELKQPAA